jgi:outer membrane lipoprotein-sorting protein
MTPTKLPATAEMRAAVSCGASTWGAVGRFVGTSGAAFLLAATLLTSCTQTPSLVLTADDQATLAQVQTYLDGLRQFHARFNQSGSDGYADGVLWLDRPGRLRVEYAEPHPRLLLANHGRLLLADQVSGATTNVPVSNTPLDMLLSDKIDLSGPVTVESMQRQPGALQVGLVKTGAPSQGRLTLQFTASPLALTGVVVQDAAGHTNTLQLYGLYRDSTLDPSLFRYHPAPTPAG